MKKLISKPTYQVKLQRFKQGGIVKAETGLSVYFNPKNWGVSREYEKDENGNMRTFNQTYDAARAAGEKEFLWNGNRYTTDYKYVPATPSQDPASDYNSLRASYIEALENPDRIGYDQARDRWTSPTQKGYDPNQIGIGLDKRTNNDVRQFLDTNKRDWLTDAEMLNLQSKSFQYFEDVLARNTKGLNLSNIKRAVAMGLLYHGHGKKLWNRNHILSKALFNGSDQDFIDAVTKFYGTNSRATRHSEYWKKHFNK